VIFSYSFLDQDQKCPEAARNLFVLKSFKKTYTVEGGIDIHKLLEQRLKHRTPLPASLAHAEPFVASIEKYAVQPVEAEISFAVDRDLKPVGFWDKGAFLRGKYDVVMRYPEQQSACVLDWKSGKIRESEDQLELGALLLMASDQRIDRVTGVNLWLQGYGTFGKPYTFKRLEKGPRWAKWLARIHAIEKRDPAVEWEKRPSGLCGYCPVKTCNYYRGG
jgi:PD-(D/E)XK nuclease superfamily